MAVDDQVDEQQPALASWQAGLESLTVALDGERPADLDVQRLMRGRQGHANIVAIRWSCRPCREVRMARLIRCECGFVARGDSEDQVVGVIRDHMASDHPALLDTVRREDLLSWIQME